MNLRASNIGMRKVRLLNTQPLFLLYMRPTRECVYESDMFGAAPLASKGRKPAEANAEPSQSTDSNEKGERGSTNMGIQRLGGWSSLLSSSCLRN